MSYHTKKTPRMDIHIEGNRGTILIKQNWQYNWLLDACSSAWTYEQKRAFHNRVDEIVWNSWGKHFFLKCTGKGAFAKTHAATKWDVNFDIGWATATGHWKVNVTKVSGGEPSPRSNVKWRAREINLDTLDLRVNRRTRGGRTYRQRTVAHEFGHAVGNTGSLAKYHGDEYRSDSKYLADKQSMMNVGQQLRDRHLAFILDQLNTMLPGVKFSKY